jgi:hypothetical protein
MIIVRAVAPVIGLLGLINSAGAQNSDFFGKSPTPSEKTIRVHKDTSITTDALFKEGPGAARAVDYQIRRLVEEKLNQQGTLDLQLKVPANESSNGVRKVGDKWIANYDLAVESIPLSSASQVSTIVLEDGSSAVIRQRNTPKSLNFDAKGSGVNAAKTSLENATAAVRAEIAWLADKQKVPVQAGSLKVEQSRLEVWVDPAEAIGKLAWFLRLVSPQVNKGHGFAVDAWVDALAPTDRPDVFEIKQLVFKDYMGIVRGVVWDPTPLDGPKLHPLASAQVIRSTPATSEREDVVVTDSEGRFRFSGGSGARRLQVRLANRYFIVKNDDGPALSLEVHAADRQPVELKYNGISELEIAQPSAFYWANKARLFVSDVLRSGDLLSIELRVNASEEDCNASWYTPDNRITLYRASPPGSDPACINRAYMHTIFHEFGHAVDHALGGAHNSAEGQAYGEGFGDALAILFTSQSCYGVNSYGPNTCMRDAANPSVLYPAEGYGIHHRGRIYSGFVWELVQEFSKTHSRSEAVSIVRRLTMQAAAQNPSGIRNAVELTLLADDDDLDLSNGTPNYRQIAAAAKARTIPIPSELPQN